MCNSSLMSLAYFQSCVNVSALPLGYLLEASTIYKSTPDLFLMFAVLVVYCQSKEGVLQCLCIIFKKGSVGRLQKTRGLV